MTVKTHFTVGYRMNRKRHIVLGVTSIVPNMNGILMFTEDGKNHFIESWELRCDDTLGGMFISYDPEDEELFLDTEVVHDHRKA